MSPKRTECARMELTQRSGLIRAKFPQFLAAGSSFYIKQGRELDSRIYWHRSVNELTLAESLEDLACSLRVEADVTGKPVELDQAPSFSITYRSQWG